MKDIAVLTLISTLILMFLTLSSMFLLQTASFNSEKPLIWEIIKIMQGLVSAGSIVLCVAWFIYILYIIVSSGSVFSKCSESQIFVYSLSLFFVLILLMLSGFIGFLIIRFLLPEEEAINRTKKEVGL